MRVISATTTKSYTKSIYYISSGSYATDTSISSVLGATVGCGNIGSIVMVIRPTVVFPKPYEIAIRFDTSVSGCIIIFFASKKCSSWSSFMTVCALGGPRSYTL